MRSIAPLLALSLFGACVDADAPDASSQPDDTASAQMEIATVPTGVLCVKVNVMVAGQNLTPPAVAVTAGSSSATLPLGVLPAGVALFSGNAYGVACGSVTATTPAAWIADPATATLSPGAVTNVAMTFRQNNTVTVGGTFVPNIAEVTVGQTATYARLADGTVLQWGIVDNSGNTPLTPAPVPGLTNVVQVVAGENAACARKSDHSVVCWGANFNGNLGPNIAINGSSSTPVAVPLPSAFDAVSGLTMGATQTCMLQGSLASCWGTDQFGELGHGTPSATPVTTPTNTTFASALFAGLQHTCAITQNAELLCTGDNFNGDLGIGTTTQANTWTPVGLKNVVQVAAGSGHTCVLMGDATVRCFGANSNGQLGTGDTTFNRALSPVTVPGLAGVVQLAAGDNFTCALMSDATVRCWGSASHLGAGVVADQVSPITVPGLTGVVAIHASSWGEHACAELADHTVKCWGSNSNGQIGNGTTTFANRPTAVQF